MHTEGGGGGDMKESIPSFLKGFRTKITQCYASDTNVTKDKPTERESQSSSSSSSVSCFLLGASEKGKKEFAEKQ